jgi:hypothetical protein
MARKPKTKTSAVPTDSNLGLSDLRLRLNFLEKENEKLLKQIETNRKKLDQFNESIQELGVQIAERLAPFRQKMVELDQEIHEVFQEILDGRKLGKKTRKDITTVYYNLQMQGLITMKKLPFDFKVMNDDDDPYAFDGENVGDGQWQGRSPDQFPEELNKPNREEQKKIRQLFLRLADRFHPDKVTDETEKAFRTEIMKEINMAYQNADLATLLAIEKQQELELLIDRDSSDDLTRHCAKVESENNFLKNQLEEVKRKLKLTKKSQQGEITATFQKISKYGGDPIADALLEVEVQVGAMEEIHKFVRDFRDRRMTIKDFLKGPQSLQPVEMTEEELMMEFLSQFR